MLDVNDFTAIRISLASPEQIRSWSYGEVTKPETINYRTLKPEKDGLFCEKIFGPTKDFECYCGKYKRVRYKGITCDKCGVEVTRSKVRRERMGHIELASPVGHIWFVKGTPSRLSILLDISPRSLERVIYFAQFIITTVDDESKQSIISRIKDEFNTNKVKLEEARQARLSDANVRLQEREAQASEEHTQALESLKQKYDAAVESLTQEADALENTLKESLGSKAKKDVSLSGATLVAKGEALSEDHISALPELHEKVRAGLESKFSEATRALIDSGESKLAAKREESTKEIESVEKETGQQISRLQAELDETLADIETVRPGMLLTEVKYRELRDKYGIFFSAGMGAEAVLEILRNMELAELREKLQTEIITTSGQRRKKATKRLRVVEAFRKSSNKPEWMVLTVLPVLPPDLRPMVQLDGGRFATSDLNDLYRRVISRNNRLKRLMELGAPEIIIRNEKRMLQEAVDSLIDNGRRGRAVANSSSHRLKSLSDLLKGKQGRFRQNLLGKRVDYSGRSVIVVGPELKLHQCGLPKRMALELFKPFVMRKLVEHGLAHNIKSAKRIVERVRPEVWDVLEEAIKDRPVLLNRAPTLHRLGIQAFEPVLIEGSAIQIHPLVCTAFNADFDGDQMAVHVPLSRYAVEEAKKLMLSTNNLLSPSSGEPIVAPTLDMVLGCYYLTINKPGEIGEGMSFSNFDEAKLAYDLGRAGLHANIKVRDKKHDNKMLETTIGRIIFNEILPTGMEFRNEVMDKKALKDIIAQSYVVFGNEITARVADDIKRLGFRFATRSGITIAATDLDVPIPKAEILHEAEKNIEEIEAQYRRGLITDEERYNSAIEIWQEATDKVSEALSASLDPLNSLYMMSTSGAKGNIAQIRQMSGMRGLMSDPSGRIIELPIKSSFREGLSVLEYFISTHGARKGLADTALRTSDSGYLTRRLVDVVQDVVIYDDDCGSTSGIWVTSTSERGIPESLTERIVGRLAASPVVDPKTGEILVDRNEDIDQTKAIRIAELGIDAVHVRSPLTCQARRSVFRMCYGWSLGYGKMVTKGEAVGIIAAQSIGEPGTQLTMRTFHTGGVAGVDITSGLPRVEELFEARVPKGQAIISEIDGVVEVSRDENIRKIKVVSSEIYRDEYMLPPNLSVLVESGQHVEAGMLLAESGNLAEESEGMALAQPVSLTARMSGQVVIENSTLAIAYEEREEREYTIPAAAHIKVETGDRVRAGDQLTEGPINPQDILRILGREAVQRYLADDIQKVYRSQGVTINDKHIEVIVRQMLRKVRVDSPGDTVFLPGELVDRFKYEEENARVLAEGGEPATAETVLLGITKASLSTDSFLAAASFQETTRVLTEAAINGAVDRLVGLKENVIIGRLIPARGIMPLPVDETLKIPEPEEFLVDEELPSPI